MIEAKAILAMGMQEGLGMTFGAGVLFWAIWCLYQWEIKPDRENRRNRAEKQIEEMHRIHWQQLARTRFQRK